jgi:hypothetical protein
MNQRDRDSKATTPCELIGWEKFNELARSLAGQLKGDGEAVDIIVAIGRGGYMPARILSDLLGIMNLATFKIEHYHGTHKSEEAFIRYPLVAEVENQRVLLVDDVSDSGDTFHVAVEHIHSRGDPGQIKTAVLHHKTVSTFVPDYYAAVVKQWRWIIYPWAVTEDLAVLISGLQAATSDPETIRHMLMENHGIEPSDVQIRDALVLLSQA